MSWLRLFLLVCWCALVPAPGHAVIIALNPSADAFVTTGPSIKSPGGIPLFYPTEAP